MTKSCFGKNIKIEISGGSHEPTVSMTMTGLPKSSFVNMSELRAFLKRRAPGNSPYATKRKEADIPILKSGGRIIDDVLVTDGRPLVMVIENTDTHSKDYNQFKTVPRPGHADFTAHMKYGNSHDKGGSGDCGKDGGEDHGKGGGTNHGADCDQVCNCDGPSMSGGGPFSARMTAPLCIAGGIALQLLEKQSIFTGAHIFSVKDRYDEPFDPTYVDALQLSALKRSSFPVTDVAAAEKMKTAISEAAADGDSLGGIVEAAVIGLPPGIGGPMYDGVESILAPILFGIPAVKGVEFGTGFASSILKGSENNDPFITKDGKVKTLTNHHGGILGGITTGMPLIVRAAFKPTPSIAKEQNSVDLGTLKPAKLSIKGRHDPCVALRAVPIVEAAIAVGLLDLMSEK